MRSLDLWAGIVASSFLGGALAVCDSGDTIGCLPFKTVQCASNVLDISFMLDRSGSMTWGMNCGGKACGQLCKEDYPATYSCQKGTTQAPCTCYRQDIMRFVIRSVLKQIFLKFQRECLEYLQTDASRSEGTCEQRGFTTTRFNIMWWATGDKARNPLYTGQVFSADGKEGFALSFKKYFYNNDGTTKGNRWETDANGVKTMKDSAIDDYFKKVLLKGSTNPGQSGDVSNDDDPWPYGSGGTEPYGGMNTCKEVLTNAYNAYTEKQKANAKFPIFLMTDGIVNGENIQDLMKDSTADLRKDVTGNPQQINLYGLGLTGAKANDLRSSQETLYDDLNYADEITITTPQGGLETVELYFNDEETAGKVIAALFTELQDGCKDCYELNGVTECVALGADVPKFGSTNSTSDRDETPNQPPPNDLKNIQVLSTITSNDRFIGIGNDVFKIDSKTKLCRNFYGDENDDNRYPGYLFTEYDDNGVCKCCNSDPKCLCDYQGEAVIGTRTVTLGSGTDAFDKEIAIYEDSSYFSSELAKLLNANITSTLAQQDGGQGGGQDSGAGDGDFNDGTDTDFDSVGDGPDNGNGGGDNSGGGGTVVKDPDQINNDATRIASLIGLTAIPAMMAAIM